MSKLRDVYGNSMKSGYSLYFFSLNAPGARSAMQAAPFFTTADPIRLLTARGCEVRLLVRLRSITTPAALADALADPPGAKVGSDVVSSRRSFLQSLRRKYDELVIPALVEVRRDFGERNSVGQIKTSLIHLLHGPGSTPTT